MINDFEDFCLWMHVVIDDIRLPMAPFFKRPGLRPECPDSELLTLALVGECRGWDVEMELLSYGQEYRPPIPTIPSRFNRRRRGLMQAFNLIRRVVLRTLDLVQDRLFISTVYSVSQTSSRSKLWPFRSSIRPY